MKTAIIDQTIWNEWKSTTCFIVDSYHYTNHHATDEICHTWCNPALQDGSAPNLVGDRIDKNGNTVKVQEFNTEACEQLNAWLGGYESILKYMTFENFNWFLHVMIFYHVKHVLAKIKKSSVQKTTANKNTATSENIATKENTTANEKSTASEESNEEDSDDDESSSDDVLQVLSNHKDEDTSDESEDENSESVDTSTRSGGSNSSESDKNGNVESENESSGSTENESSESDIYMHLSN